MPVYRVTIHPVGQPEGTSIAGDFIAEDVVTASRLAGTMAMHPVVAPIVAEGFTVVVELSTTDPRFAANYDGPRVHVSSGGQC